MPLTQRGLKSLSFSGVAVDEIQWDKQSIRLFIPRVKMRKEHIDNPGKERIDLLSCILQFNHVNYMNTELNVYVSEAQQAPFSFSLSHPTLQSINKVMFECGHFIILGYWGVKGGDAVGRARWTIAANQFQLHWEGHAESNRS